MQNAAKRIKLVAVGDGATGKTCILIRYAKDEFKEDKYIPTIFETYSTTVQFNNEPISLDLMDTAGQEEYGELRQLSYGNTDVFIIVFDVTSPQSYQNAIHKWYKELQESNPDSKKVFIGNKIDIRDSDNSEYIKYAQAYKEITALGCKYAEVSAKTNEGIQNAFQQAITIALKPKSTDKKKDKKKGKDKNKKEKESKCTIF